MAVMKEKWINFVKLNNSLIKTTISSLFETQVFESLITQLDTKVASKIDLTLNNVGIKNMLDEVINVLIGDNSRWEELPIYYSSFKEKDKRIIYNIYNKLLQYIGFYNKILEHDGVAKNIAKVRSYGQNGTASSTNKNYYSETPQVGNLNFDTAIIEYASNLSKDTNDETNALVGNSNETESGSTWDEALQNVRMVFYNDLIDFIANIPAMVYSYYALDSVPYPELISAYVNNLKNIWEL